ncbi:MAG: type IV pili methyl-accepting chemotaxis transducer N-terminal domain-containing protein [Rhodobacteraceae bacterium]|nr:type IV pili methyl-accepting chemotaxis transducer N-terminal domain-containing protein [Paracoccaceae bacterium]
MKTFAISKFGHALSVLAIVLPAISPISSVAQEAADETHAGRHRIDIAGRQRMLTQRIAKSICFIHHGEEVEMHLDMLANDHELFSDTLNILIEGGGEFHLEPEHDRRTLDELHKVAELWGPFDEKTVHIIATGVVSKEDEEYVDTHDLELLNYSNRAVSLIEQTYANPNTLNMATAITLNIFGRQRMLAQRAAKDFCFISTGYKAAEERVDLQETQNIFTLSLNAIHHGLPEMGIAPPPTDEITAQLEIVAEIWGGMNEVFLSVIAGADPTVEQISFIAMKSNLLQDAMNEAVHMYSDN